MLYDVFGDVPSLARDQEEDVARYPFNLPLQLKQEVEQWASEQSVLLNQFILWSVADKVGSLKQSLDDPAFPRITYRRGGQRDNPYLSYTERAFASRPS